MIRLTLNAQSDPEIHLFNKSIILLGAETAQVDLPLSGFDIQPIHLKIIIEQNGFPILVNCANDPFVSVNGHSFGKKLLNSGDIISIHQTIILFENLNSLTSQIHDRQEKAADSLLENKIKRQEEPVQPPQLPPSTTEANFLSFSLPFEQEVEALNEEELQSASMKKYLKEVESSPQAPKSPSTSIPRQKNTISLKDDYLKDLEEDSHNEKKVPFVNSNERSHLYQAWKWILLFIFSLLSITAAIGTIIYFSVSDKTEAQETKAIQGVADLAMALTHAQLSHLKPHNQNWSDVDFLKNNLQTMLPETSSFAAQIDAQGQFNCCPYSLRIYTSRDLSHFLLIAQPAPNLLYWLIPQSIIVVDSHLMELRRLKDVRSLNRLLANTDPLDELNGKEITNLVRQGELIRLSALANDSGHLDFAPPKNLAWVRPGAENLIYNAPRYHRLGQNLVYKAIRLSTSKGSSQEVATLKQDVEHFKWLNHFVLYSEQGKKSAVLARQGLLMFAPSDHILFGYLLFNAQGKIHQVYLLKSEKDQKENSFANLDKDNTIIAFQPFSEFESREESNKKNLENHVVDQNHPIYIHLQTLVTARENELKPLISALFAMMNQELQNPKPQFQIEFQNLIHTYLMENSKHKQLLKENVDSLYQQYEDIPLLQFLAFIKELHLDHLIQQEDQSIALIDENCQLNMETLLNQIENSKSLTELDNFIHIAMTWLNFDYIKDPHELMKYQNLLRNQLLEQLERYLLSSKKFSLVKSEDKDVLNNILCQERLIKPDERDFFMGEFEELLTPQQACQPSLEANSKRAKE
jgi:hypothetical protein